MNKVIKLMSKTQVNQTPTSSAKQSKDAPTSSEKFKRQKAADWARCFHQPACYGPVATGA